MIEKIQHATASSSEGARGLVKGVLACAFQNMAFMLPTGLLYLLVKDLLAGSTSGRTAFYLLGCLGCFALILLTTWFQYNGTYFTTYKESGTRRLTLAERLRKLPLSFFGKRDLADLTSTIMADCEVLEKTCSHFIPGLFGSLISTVIIALSLFAFDWRMALAALWVTPVSAAIVVGSYRVQDKVQAKTMAAKMACADGIQEYIETLRDLKASNAEQRYLSGLSGKIRAVEKQSIAAELETALFVSSASMVLKLGIASVALTGSVLLVQGSIDVLTLFLFLMAASRMYDPMQGALQNLAAVIAMRTNVGRMNEILDAPLQTGSEQLTNQGCDIVFDHVGFAYNSGETVLRDVSFTAKQGEVTALVGPSGGGKTTVSRLAARFWDYQKGSITVGGMEVSRIDPEKLMSLYSIVFQDVTLFDNTILENIRLGRKGATDEEVLAAAKLALREGRPVDLAIREHAVNANNRRYSKVNEIAKYLVPLIPAGGTVMTQCFGETIVGMMLKEAKLAGKDFRLFCPETRPYFQGARLTATVCHDMGFDVTVITDNMPAFVMEREHVDLFTCAADAICLDGYVVNKVGTFQNAIVAKYMGIPYFVTGAPDQGHETVDSIHIEMRDPNFTLQAMGVRTAMEGVKGYYPAFDITPPHLVSGVVTDLGIYSPYDLHRYFTDGSIGKDNLVI